MENNVIELNPQQQNKIDDTASANSIILNPEVMKQIDFISEMMSTGKSTVPNHLMGSKADCFAIVLQAAQWGMNPFAVAQKTHLVNGTLGYEAQLVNAVVSSSNAIKGRFKYEYDGDWKSTSKGSTACVRVGAVLSGESDITWGEWIFVGEVTTKNSPLWKTAPKQQSSYLAVKYWARLYCPEVILGVYSHDEFEPEQQQEKEINPHQTESINGEVVNEVTIDQVLEKITNAQSMAELNAGELVSDLKCLKKSDMEAAQKKWTGRREELKTEFIKNKPDPVQEINLESKINNCKTADELTALIDTMPPGDEMKHGDAIDTKYDYFR